MILTLDLASNTGYVFGQGNGTAPHKYGAVRFLEPNSHEGLRFMNFWTWLHEIREKITIDKIYYEDIHRHVANQAAHIYGGLKAVLLMFSFETNIELVPVGVGVWKKGIGLKGNAKKNVIFDWASCHYDLDKAVTRYKNDIQDVCDALGIYHYASENTVF